MKGAPGTQLTDQLLSDRSSASEMDKTGTELVDRDSGTPTSRSREGEGWSELKQVFSTDVIIELGNKPNRGL
jgi:hypothetical protein